MPPAYIGILAFGVAQASSVIGSLSGLQWLLPNQGNLGLDSCFCPTTASVLTTMGGLAGHPYTVTLRFRGPLETKAYTGGTTVGFFNTDGTPSGSLSNIYKLVVSSPAHTYYINAGPDSTQEIWHIDYNATIVINGGALVTLAADSVEGAETRNSLPCTAIGAGYSVPGITNPPQPYAGQFCQMDVVSIA